MRLLKNVKKFIQHRNCPYLLFICPTFSPYVLYLVRVFVPFQLFDCIPADFKWIWSCFFISRVMLYTSASP